MSRKFSLNWSPSPKYCASVLHMLASIAYTQQVEIQGWNYWIAIPVWVVIWGLKEFLLDTGPLEQDSYLGDLLDWIMYMVGVVVALVSLFSLWLAICLLILVFVIAVLVDMESQRVLFRD